MRLLSFNKETLKQLRPKSASSAVAHRSLRESLTVIRNRQNSPDTPAVRTQSSSQLIHETLHLDLDHAVALAYFLLSRGTKAHALVETSSTAIPLNDLQP